MIVTLVDSGLPDSTSSEAVRSTKRRGTDLIYSYSVSLQQALKSEPVAIPTLDGRILKVSVDQLITPKSVIKIEGEGMPILEQSNHPLNAQRRGDLYVRFEIQFPKKLSEAQRVRLDTVLLAK